MADLKQEVQERRTGTQDLIGKLNQERDEMLMLFCRTAGLEPYHSNQPVQAVLQRFCQVLVDYVAVGHFTLYERILNGTERRQEIVRLAERLYPDIAETTDAAVLFNDKYDCEDHCEIGDSLAADLSALGEKLATRIGLEDQLIVALESKS
ncbi:MAG TPA: Rsd/AlgQ family anti-sigma factor [Acidiferrobacteraceae bacterium]|nr:Rsd/AlgQ family anti-sigma factor [Acidiferrobacteraceae bacterium]